MRNNNKSLLLVLAVTTTFGFLSSYSQKPTFYVYSTPQLTRQLSSNPEANIDLISEQEVVSEQNLLPFLKTKIRTYIKDDSFYLSFPNKAVASENFASPFCIKFPLIEVNFFAQNIAPNAKHTHLKWTINCNDTLEETITNSFSLTKAKDEMFKKITNSQLQWSNLIIPIKNLSLSSVSFISKNKDTLDVSGFHPIKISLP